MVESGNDYDYDYDYDDDNDDYDGDNDDDTSSRYRTPMPKRLDRLKLTYCLDWSNHSKVVNDDDDVVVVEDKRAPIYIGNPGTKLRGHESKMRLLATYIVTTYDRSGLRNFVDEVHCQNSSYNGDLETPPNTRMIDKGSGILIVEITVYLDDSSLINTN
ncbi:hypothetical protein M0804_003980 [Polistes exclamans]|nr:hypothetical protein M0804_003980 [Polistes exclamans]